jgi:DNA invertase Pin-like site-specific DNA recombinase
MNQTLGYARVSTADQNPDLQVDELTAAGCHRIFVEHASGVRAERPQLAQALDHLRSGDTLVVWRLDRLARSLRDLLDVVTTREQWGIGFRSLHEPVDTTSPGGRLVFHLFGTLAEFERELIRERSLAGLAAARASGSQRRPAHRDDAGEDRPGPRALQGACPHRGGDRKALGVSRASIYRHVVPHKSSTSSE